MARRRRTDTKGLHVLRVNDPSVMAGYYYRYRFNLRFIDPITGEQDRVTKSWPKQAKRALVAREAERLYNDISSGAYSKRKHDAKNNVASATIAEIAPQVVEHREREGGSPATLYEFRSIAIGVPRGEKKDGTKKKQGIPGGHIVRHLGGFAPHELTPKRLADFIDALIADELAPLTVRNVFKVLNVFIRIVRVRMLDPHLKSNVVKDALEMGLKLPKKDDEDPIWLPLAETVKIVTCPDVPEERRVRYVLAFFSGMRDGEIAGLRWASIDFDTATAKVDKAFAVHGGLRRPKTGSSQREVPLHATVVHWLRSWRDGGWQALTGREPHDEDPVFPMAPVLPGPDAQLSHDRPPSAERLAADMVTAKVKAPEGMTFHGTRRSFSRYLRDVEVPGEVIEAIVGHKPKSILGKHYAPPTLDQKRAAVARLTVPSCA